MLQQALEPTPPPDETKEEHGEPIDTGEKVILIVINSNFSSLNGRGCSWMYIFSIWKTFFTSHISAFDYHELNNKLAACGEIRTHLSVFEQVSVFQQQGSFVLDL